MPGNITDPEPTLTRIPLLAFSIKFWTSVSTVVKIFISPKRFTTTKSEYCKLYNYVYIRKQDWQLLSVMKFLGGKAEKKYRYLTVPNKGSTGITVMGIRIMLMQNPDTSFSFHKNTDPTFPFNADPDPAPRQRDANLRPLVYRPSLNSFLSLHASIVVQPWPSKTLMRLRIRIWLSL